MREGAKRLPILLALSLFSASQLRAAGRPSVALMPFENLSGRKDLDWLKSAIPENLMVPFSEAGIFRVLERLQLDKVLKEVKLSQSGLVDPKDAPALGHFIGVSWMVLGSFQIAGNNILIKSRTVKVETAEVGASLQVQGDLDRAFVLQDELGRKVLLKLAAESAGGLAEAPAPSTATGRLPLDAFERMEKARALLKTVRTLEADPLRIKKAPQFEAALTDLRAVLAGAPDLPEALILAGRLAGQVDDKKEEAEAFLRKASGLGSEEAWTDLGHLLRELSRGSEAAEAYRKALALNASSSESWYGLAVLAQRQGNWQEAADDSLKALQANPALEEAFALVKGLSRNQAKLSRIQIPEARAFCLGLAALDQDEGSKASRLFQAALDGYPDLAQAQLGLGLASEGQVRKRALFRAMELAPLDPEINLAFAKDALDRSDCEAAAPALQKYLVLSSEGEDLPWAREQLDACRE